MLKDVYEIPPKYSQSVQRVDIFHIKDPFKMCGFNLLRADNVGNFT